MYRNLVRYNRILSRMVILVSSLLLANGICLQIYQLQIRSKLGIGLTDEAYGLLNAIDRSANGQTSQTQLFADVNFILLRIAHD
jgi:hypothetical protein